jgi:hypothetical protein
MTTFVKDDVLEPDGYVQIFPTTVRGIQGGNGRVCSIQCLVAPVRYRDDGTDPTTTVGMLINAGETIWYPGDLTHIKFIEVTSGAELNISRYK